MNRLILLAIILLAPSMIQAQYYDQKGHFCISAGLSVPVADFASTDTTYIGAGYGRLGYSGMVLPRISLTEFIGFAGLLGFSRNPYNIKEMEGQYRIQHPSRQYTFTSDPYALMNFMGGISFNVPQGSIDLTLNGYLGLAVALLPATTAVMQPDQPGDPMLELQTEKNRSSAFAYGGGVNVLYYASDKIGITFHVIYLYCRPEFNAVQISVYEDGELTVLSAIDLQQKFQVINLGVGIAFLF